MVLAAVIAITVALTLSIDWSAKYIPFSFEQSLVNSAADFVDTEPNEVDSYLQSLADELAVKMDLTEDYILTMHYVNQDVVNAGATLGGHIMIYRGILEKIPDENTLVMLLGHEIAHVKHRHPVRALGKGVVLSLVIATVFGQSDTAAKFITDASMITLLSFSREQEELSDIEGLQLLNSHYGHTNGAVSLFEMFKKEELENVDVIPEFLRSHPETDNRIDHLKQYVTSHNWLAEGQTRAIPANIRTILLQDKQNQEKEI